MGEKIGARLRLISLNLSIRGISLFSHREFYALVNQKLKIVRIRLQVLIMENVKRLKISIPVG
jgi:hypothetical protein